MCFISEVLESHVGENSTAGVVKTQVGHIREGLQVVTSVLTKSFGYKLIMIIITKALNN